MKIILKRILFYFLSFTWGALLSTIGLLMLIPFLITGNFGTFHGRVYGIFPSCFGENWGFEMGCFFFLARNMKDNDYIKRHECGHGLQNIILGVFQLVIQFWSMGRYWYREWLRKHNKPITTDYDSIWFEKWATEWGTKYVAKDIL